MLRCMDYVYSIFNNHCLFPVLVVRTGAVSPRAPSRAAEADETASRAAVTAPSRQSGRT